MVPESAKPSSVKGYGAWALALLIAGFLAISLMGTLYARVLPPVERTDPVASKAAIEAKVAAEHPVPQPLPEPGPYPDQVQANVGLCGYNGTASLSCRRAAIDRADAENERRNSAWQEKSDAWSDRQREIQDATSDRRRAEIGAPVPKSRPLPARLAERWQFWVGLLLLGGSIAAGANREQPALPAHRDPEGAAVAAVKADHAAGGAPLAVAGAAGAALLATLHSFGAFVLVGGLAALVAWGSVASARRNRLTAEGYRVADAQWQEQAHAAEHAGQPAPPEPRVAVAQAQNLGTTGGFVAPEGSAMAALLDAAGRPNPAAAAWFRIAQAMGLGSVDAAGRFQPWAAVEHAVWFADTGDVELAFRLDDVTKTAADMTRVTGPLLREMRVRSLIGGAFATRHTDGRVIGRFTNNVNQAAPALAVADVDDDWDF